MIRHGMTIGEVAQTVGVSTKTIRFWEIRKLVPKVERSPAGYRLFTDIQLARIQFIRQGQRLGLTLSEIGEILSVQDAGKTPCAKVLQVIDRHIEQIDRTLDDLRRLRQTLVDAQSTANQDCSDRTQRTVCPIIRRADRAPSEHYRIDSDQSGDP